METKSIDGNLSFQKTYLLRLQPHAGKSNFCNNRIYCMLKNESRLIPEGNLSNMSCIMAACAWIWFFIDSKSIFIFSFKRVNSSQRENQIRITYLHQDQWNSAFNQNCFLLFSMFLILSKKKRYSNLWNS